MNLEALQAVVIDRAESEGYSRDILEVAEDVLEELCPDMPEDERETFLGELMRRALASCGAI